MNKLNQAQQQKYNEVIAENLKGALSYLEMVEIEKK